MPGSGGSFQAWGIHRGDEGGILYIISRTILMKVIDATGKEWRKECLRCVHAGEDFMVTGFLAEDLPFFRNVGIFYHYAVGQTKAAFYFRRIGEDAQGLNH